MRGPIAIFALCVFSCNVPARADRSGWLDARDFGASGSKFETVGTTTNGSKSIAVKDAGDFKAGQGVMVSRCNIHYSPIQLWGTGLPYYNRKPLNNSVEVRGFDGSAGNWVIYILDIEASSSPAFRWTDDLGRTWHPKVPISGDWQPLGGGTEVRLHKRDWESGYVIAFGARDQLITKIEKVEGNVLTLADAANGTVADAVVKHNDTLALQNAVTEAIKQKKNLRIAPGHYRLAKSIRVERASAIAIEGSSSTETLLDISDGEGACFTLAGGTEVTIRNFQMLGFMGFDERDKAGYINTRGSTYIWGFGLKHCNGITIGGTERVLVENCHARRMSGECFVSGGKSRGAVKPGETHSQWITYRRCSVTDSARNAFNDVMCGTENTSVLNCRIVDVGGCSWEGASRFVKFIGNYVRNGGTVAMGNLGPANRDDTYPALGAGQHIIADNVFESRVPYGGCAVRTAVGATQVIIRNNLFVNFGSSAVEASGNTDATHYASGNTVIAGNIFDMTCVGTTAVQRTAVNISANDTIVSDNQIYVRGEADATVTGIRLREPALNVGVHDNLIRNCGVGMWAMKGDARVSEVVDDRTFLRSNSPSGLPLERIRPWLCDGWTLAWLNPKGLPTGARSVIESFDPESLRFRLREPHPMKVGERFEVIAPALNWLVHDNTVSGCLQPVKFDAYGSETSIFRANLIERGGVTNVSQAFQGQGRFILKDNHIAGFDEGGAAAGSP